MKIIIGAARKLNIKILRVPAGIHAVKKNKIGDEEFKYCDYYLAPNKIRQYKKKLKKKIIIIGSPRYRQKWIVKLSKIYKPVPSLKNKINIYIPKRNKGHDVNQLNRLEEYLSKKNDINTLSNNKPRDYLPTKCTRFYEDYRTSQLIGWCDFFLTSRHSSVLLQASKQNKIIILLGFINPNLSKSYFINSSKNIYLVKNLKALDKILEENKKKRKIKFLDEKNVRKFYFNDQFIENKLSNFYNKFENKIKFKAK